MGARGEPRKVDQTGTLRMNALVSTIWLLAALVAVQLRLDNLAGCQASELDARGLQDGQPAPEEGRGRQHETEEGRTSGLAAESGEPPVGTNRLAHHSDEANRLRIVRLLAPEAVQNGTQNVTIDCMFKFDKKLDQRLTVKWFFNDELEPIYQWIPELNKRVYSDRYERFLDKSYELTEDVDFQLQAYRWLLDESAEAKLREREEEEKEEGEEPASRRLLAGRINKLAKLGGRHSRQLLHSLRRALHLEEADFGRFRALRLVRPTGELGGRFTCSVSSLHADDLRSTRLLVYEPAKSLAFNVTRLSHHHYNLTCSALGLFPRPQLQLARYRAGPELAGPAARQPTRPKLAATSLRQEPLAGAHTQLVLRSAEPGDPNELQPSESAAASYDIHSWALVEEASLSSNVVSQFECLLSIEGSPYERRQSLALQRGWHVNANNQNQRQTFVGLFSALASLLCLILALICSLLIFRLLKRHASNRIQHLDKPDAGGRSSAGSSQSTPLGSSNLNSQTLTHLATEVGPKQTSDDEPEGVYRIPERSAYGTRFLVGPSNGQAAQHPNAPPYATPADNKANGNGESQPVQAGPKQPATYESQLKPLYC